MKNALRILAGCLLLAASFFCACSLRAEETSERVTLFPRFVPGQSVTYEIGYSADSNTITESAVAAPMAPTGGKTEVHLLLRAEVEGLGVDAGMPSARLRTYLLLPDSLPGANAASSERTSSDAKPSKMVEFTLYHNGQVTDLIGLDALSPDEQTAWREWLARFGVAGALPEKGLKPGDKWRTEEPIANALLTGLSWDKESQYVDDEPCGAASGSSQSDSSPAVSAQETCAVILTTATLKQRSPQKDATPEDYKLHDLRTSGIARGKNEVITYISLKTGLVVRATEDANQSMNVTVAKTDGSNRVHYTINADSHTQVLLLADSPSARP
jgi:hypothetical protein